MSLQETKKRVLEANLEIVRLGLVQFTWGNVSARDPVTGFIVIKPSGVPYDRLSAADMVVTDLNGEVIDGVLNPSSDLPTHLVLYRAWPSVGGVVHTHSTYATEWAQARKAIPCYGTTHADTFFGDVPCAAILSREMVGGEYEKETGNSIIRTIGERCNDVPGVLCAGHGPFAWGDTPENAVYHAAVLEQVARMASGTLLINPEAEPIPEYLLQKHYQRKHGPNAYYGQNRGK